MEEIIPIRVRLSGNLYNPIVPYGAISIVRPGIYGNPYKVLNGDVNEAIRLFESALLDGRLKYTLEDIAKDLRGFNLACWCKLGQPCHGDILIKYANIKKEPPH